MAKKTFIREISFKAQSASRVYVEFQGVEIRGVMYRGQAWFDVTAGKAERATKDFDRSHNLWVYREGVSLTAQDNVSPSAREAVGLAIGQQVQAWLNDGKSSAVPSALLEAERERLGREIADTEKEVQKHAQALAAAQHKLAALRGELNRAPIAVLASVG